MLLSDHFNFYSLCYFLRKLVIKRGFFCDWMVTVGAVSGSKFFSSDSQNSNWYRAGAQRGTGSLELIVESQRQQNQVHTSVCSCEWRRGCAFHRRCPGFRCSFQKCPAFAALLIGRSLLGADLPASFGVDKQMCVCVHCRRHSLFSSKKGLFSLP